MHVLCRIERERDAICQRESSEKQYQCLSNDRLVGNVAVVNANCRRYKHTFNRAGYLKFLHKQSAVRCTTETILRTIELKQREIRKHAPSPYSRIPFCWLVRCMSTGGTGQDFCYIDCLLAADKATIDIQNVKRFLLFFATSSIYESLRFDAGHNITLYFYLMCLRSSLHFFISQFQLNIMRNETKAETIQTKHLYFI